MFSGRLFPWRRRVAGAARFPWCAFFFTSGFLLVSPVTLAAEARDVAVAEALFAEGRQLLTEGRYDEACPKLAESQRLDPGTGTALNLADCYEKQGRLATAWGIWLEAAALARQAGQEERESHARMRAEEVERQLHRVVITVPETTYVEGLRVARDGVEVRQAAWGTPLPLDPGEHTIEVTAPGRETYRTIVSIEPGPGHTEIVIPPLAESEPETNVLAVDTPARGVGDGATSDPGATRRTIGVVVGSVGAAGLIAGGIFGLRAISLNSSSQDECRTERFCSQAGVELRNDARAAGNWATILGGVGGALVATGIVLWVTAPESGGPELSAVTTGEGASLLLRGTF